MKISKPNLLIVSLILVFLILLAYFFISYKKSENLEIKCPNTPEKYNCWREALDETLNKHGLAASFELLAKLYDTEPDFVSECHSFTHDLGEKSYQIFSRHENLEMTPKASYCGYGFYHGFMETLLHSGGSIKQAQDFCADADRQLSAYGSKALIACYHGIGHGAVDGSDPRAWGDPQKLIEPGLRICKTVSTLQTQIDQCGTGVFNALAIALNANSFNLNSSENPYKICLTQDEDFKKSCYEQMNSRAITVAKGDFAVAAKFVLSIPEEKYAIVAMEQLAASVILGKIGKNTNYNEDVKTCRTLPEHLRKSCIDGLVGGIMEFGKPDYEYVEAMDFCDSLSSNEQDIKICYSHLASSAGVVYSTEKANQICDIIDKKYGKICK